MEILLLIIDEEQFCFVKGRYIHESIALAQVVVTDLDRNVEGGNLISKFDMSKTYDRLKWRFFLRTLRAMCLSSIFQDIIYWSISVIWYLININGELTSQFRSTKGFRQSDPLSRLLFIISHQILSYNSKRLEEQRRPRPTNSDGMSHPFSFFICR